MVRRLSGGNGESSQRTLRGEDGWGIGAIFGTNQTCAAGEGDPEDYRNGSYLRHLLTEIGDLIVRIPRSRKGFVSRVLEAYKRRSRSVDQLIMACFVLGMSTRKVSTALLSLLGERISASTVSEVAKRLDDAVRRYHERKLEDGYGFLFFDGVVLKQKEVVNVQKKTILYVYGMTWEGEKEMFDFLLAT